MQHQSSTALQLYSSKIFSANSLPIFLKGLTFTSQRLTSGSTRINALGVNTTRGANLEDGTAFFDHFGVRIPGDIRPDVGTKFRPSGEKSASAISFLLFACFFDAKFLEVILDFRCKRGNAAGKWTIFAGNQSANVHALARQLKKRRKFDLTIKIFSKTCICLISTSLAKFKNSFASFYQEYIR